MIPKIFLRTAKAIHTRVRPEDVRFGRNWYMFANKEYASGLISKAIESERPLMVGRLGSTEMLCMTNYLGVKYPENYKSIARYIRGQVPPWWWHPAALHQISAWSGFFPSTVENVERFCELMIADLEHVDILGSWLKEEEFFARELASAKRIMLEDLEPFFIDTPWTHALRDRRVLVVHPFADTIASQYRQREKVFPDGLLPPFDLQVLRAVQSIAGEKTPFADWFEALEHMQNDISSRDFDVAILGCGAYGFPLAAHIKRMGRQAIHMGGSTQLLFGIKGARWETFLVYPYANLFNNNWVRPSDAETPSASDSVEDGCYW